MTATVVLSINTSWNIVNFRSGLIRRLQAEGFRVVAVSPVDVHVPALIAMGVEHVPIAMDSKGVSVLSDLRLMRQYRRILARLRPVAFLGWTVKPNVYGSIAAHMLNIPTINNVSGLGTAFIRRGPLTLIVAMLYRIAFGRSATVFFQNSIDRSLFVTRKLVAPGKAALLPGSGIDTSAFAPGSSDQPAGAPFTFLLVARLLRDKGIGEYVAAARLLRPCFPAVRFQLLGSLGAANRTAIDRKEVDAWTSEGLIEYLGHAEDVKPFVAAADCVVLPSYREGMPRALLEAAALAKPLVATDVPGCTEIARAGENALLCRARDPESLAAAMAGMMELPLDRRRAMGAAGRRIAETEFDERIVADRYIAALRRALT